MTKLWTMRCLSIDKLSEVLKIFSEFSLSAMIFQEISLSFQGFPWFLRFYKIFPDFPWFLWVLWALLEEKCHLAE